MEPTDTKKDGKKDDKKPKADIWNSLLNSVLKNPFIWGMALTYFFIYVVRQVSHLPVAEGGVQGLLNRKPGGTRRPHGRRRGLPQARDGGHGGGCGWLLGSQGRR